MAEAPGDCALNLARGQKTWIWLHETSTGVSSYVIILSKLQRWSGPLLIIPQSAPPAPGHPHDGRARAEGVTYRPRRYHSLGSRRNRHERQRRPLRQQGAVLLALSAPAGQHRRSCARGRRPCVSHRAQRARRRPRLPVLVANERRRQLPRQPLPVGDRRHGRLPDWHCSAHARLRPRAHEAGGARGVPRRPLPDGTAGCCRGAAARHLPVGFARGRQGWCGVVSIASRVRGPKRRVGEGWPKLRAAWVMG